MLLKYKNIDKENLDDIIEKRRGRTNEEKNIFSNFSFNNNNFKYYII